MTLSTQPRQQIEALLLRTVREKLKAYQPETESMPFHYRLLGRDRYAVFSFIHSMNTTFGASLWEQIAVILARAAGYQAVQHYKLLGVVDGKTEEAIRILHRNLRAGQATVDKKEETEAILATIVPGAAEEDPDTVVDLYVKIGDQENYFDITSAKPNMKEFAALKLKLLRWSGLRLSQDRKADVWTRLAIPYNPYHPEPYERWTLKGLYDLAAGEILVAENFWNFVAGADIFQELLDTFEAAGKKLRPELDAKFREFSNLQANL